jgi:hypothetical protein
VGAATLSGPPGLSAASVSSTVNAKVDTLFSVDSTLLVAWAGGGRAEPGEPGQRLQGEALHDQRDHDRGRGEHQHQSRCRSAAPPAVVSGLAAALISSYQGIALLTTTFRDPQLMTPEARRLERWIDSLAGSRGQFPRLPVSTSLTSETDPGRRTP